MSDLGAKLIGWIAGVVNRKGLLLVDITAISCDLIGLLKFGWSVTSDNVISNSYSGVSRVTSWTPARRSDEVNDIKQCAADRTWLAETIDPEQMDSLPSVKKLNRMTAYGNWFLAASLPPAK